MAGRRPKPTALKELAGNPGHRPLNDDEIKPPAGVPEKPKGLGKCASREWDFIVQELLLLGVVTIVDRKALVEYCKAVEISELAYRDMQKHGLMIDEPVLLEGVPIMDGNKALVRHKKNPAVDAWKTATGVMKSFLIEFGLTPASRSKLKIKPAKEENQDPMAKVLSRSGGVEELKKNAPLGFNTNPKPILPGVQPAAQISGTPDVASQISDADISFDA